MTLQEMQRQLGMCCGGGQVNRKPLLIHKRHLTAIERMEQEQAEARAMYEELNLLRKQATNEN